MRQADYKTIISEDPPLEFTEGTVWARLFDKQLYYPKIRLNAWVTDDHKSVVPFVDGSKITVTILGKTYTHEVHNEF